MCPIRARREVLTHGNRATEGRMRLMFAIYVAMSVAGLAYFFAIGLAHA
jgi:hypothetical protein